jgi:hypothetical protein
MTTSVSYVIVHWGASITCNSWSRIELLIRMCVPELYFRTAREMKFWPTVEVFLIITEVRNCHAVLTCLA